MLDNHGSDKINVAYVTITSIHQSTTNVKDKIINFDYVSGSQFKKSTNHQWTNDKNTLGCIYNELEIGKTYVIVMKHQQFGHKSRWLWLRQLEVDYKTALWFQTNLSYEPTKQEFIEFVGKYMASKIVDTIEAKHEYPVDFY